jgi:transposase-like protein
MATNSVQFQKGLSLLDFLEQYGTEEQCHEALVTLRWSGGFICPKCGGKHHCYLEKRKLFQCNKCHHQTSVSAGTIYHGSQTALTKWFLVSFFLTQSKNSISTLELARFTGLTWKTANRIRHKFLQVMLERDAGKKLAGRIEIDDAYMGGKQHGGKRGRGSENKRPFIAVVETTPCGQPVRIHLRCIKGFSLEAIEAYATTSLTAGSHVLSDGLSCFTAVTKAGCTHEAKITTGNKVLADSVFKWVNTIIGNLKTATTGTFHGVSKKYLPRYLAEFEYRFNRRYKLADMIKRLAYISLRTPPMPEKFLKMAEPMA